ncbi:MAG: M14 family zinc carboxypeptidase [Oscillospiraceae bacterium]
MQAMVLDYTKKPSYDEIYLYCKNFTEKYNFIKCFDIGKTYLKRNIPALAIGNLEKPTLFAGCFHSLEWLTTLLLIKFIEDVCLSYNNCVLNSQIFDNGINIKQILEKHGLIIVPLVNCDGIDLSCKNYTKEDIKQNFKKYSKTILKIMEKDNDALSKWQANIRGVDLNHNYNAGYDILKIMEKEKGIIEPTYSLYGGKTFESEKETKAMIRLLKKFNFSKVFAFHSQGKEIYYSYGKHTPPQSKYIADILGKMTGYTVCHPEGMASHGGFKDYFIKHYHKPGFTFEIGEGKNPLPAEDLNEIYKDMKNAMAVALAL